MADDNRSFEDQLILNSEEYKINLILISNLKINVERYFF